MGYDITGTVQIPAEAWVALVNSFAPGNDYNEYSNPRIEGGELVFDLRASTEAIPEAKSDPRVMGMMGALAACFTKTGSN